MDKCQRTFQRKTLAAPLSTSFAWWRKRGWWRTTRKGWHSYSYNQYITTFICCFDVPNMRTFAQVWCGDFPMFWYYINTLIFQQEEIRKMAMEMKEKKEREKRQWKIWWWFHRMQKLYEIQIQGRTQRWNIERFAKAALHKKMSNRLEYRSCIFVSPVSVISLQNELLDFCSECDFKCLPKTLAWSIKRCCGTFALSLE